MVQKLMMKISENKHFHRFAFYFLSVFIFFCLLLFPNSITSVYATVTKNDTTGTYTDDFTDATGLQTSSGAGVNTGTGKVQLRNSSNGYVAPYNSTGYVIVKTIRPLRVAKWGTVNITGTFPEGTTVKLQAIDEGDTVYSDTYLLGNSAGIASFPVDISGISPLAWADGDLGDKIPQIRFKLTLSTTLTSATPEIDSFTFTWTLTQGDLSASTFDSTSPWTASYGNQKAHNSSRYSNNLVYPAFRWVTEKNYGNTYSSIFVLNDRLVSLERWWNGRMASINRDTGAIISQMPYQSFTYGVMSQNGTLYNYFIGDDDVHALDTNNSSLKWSYNFYGGHGNSSVAIGNDGTLYSIWVQTNSREIYLYAFNPDSSFVTGWPKTDNLGVAGEGANPSPISVGDDGTLYFTYNTFNTTTQATTSNGKLRAVNPTDGSTLWEYAVGNSNLLPPLIGTDGTIYITDYDYSRTREIKIWAIHSTGDEKGTLKWSKSFGVGDRGFSSPLTLRSDGNISAFYLTSALKTNVYELDKDSGDTLWSETKDNRYGYISSDSSNGIYYTDEIDGSVADDYIQRLNYVDATHTLKWQILKPYTYVLDGGNTSSYYFGYARLDERGWAYSGIQRDYSDGDYNPVHANEFSQIFALAPWTLSVTADKSSGLNRGETVTFSVTSAMQQKNNLFDSDNKVQLLMDNGDKVALSYDTTNSSGDTVWTGNYTLPSDITDGTHSYTVEASQSYLQTDITTNFVTPPDFSNNTGIVLNQSFCVGTPCFSTSTQSTSPTCNDTIPGSSPNLFQIDTSSTKATLYFAPAKGPVNKYFIAYGLSKDKLEYGVEFSSGHSDGVIPYTINLLSPNTNYYFKVRAGNGCMPGSWSDIMRGKTSSTSNFAKKSFYLKDLNEIITTYKIPLSHLPQPIPSINLINTPTPTIDKDSNPLSPPAPVPSTNQKQKHCFLFFCW